MAVFPRNLKNNPDTLEKHFMSHTAGLKPLCLLYGWLEASLSGAFCDTQHWVFDVYKAAIQADKKAIDASPLN